MSVQRPTVVPPASRFAMPLPVTAEPGNDLVAIGADLAPGTLLTAYRTGLFPMPIEPTRRRSKLAWYSPDPRGIIPLERFHESRTLSRSRRRYRVEFDTDFRGVMEACADPHRHGYWITPDFVDAYCAMFELGWARSVEVYDDADQLVGGVYGVMIDRFFAGESMFHRATDASKVALAALVDDLRDSGVTLFDVQWTTPHLRSLGATDVRRDDYIGMLVDALD